MHRKNEGKLKNCARRSRAEEPTAPNKLSDILTCKLKDYSAPNKLSDILTRKMNDKPAARADNCAGAGYKECLFKFKKRAQTLRAKH